MAFIYPKEPGGDKSSADAQGQGTGAKKIKIKKKEKQIKYARLSVFRATKSFPTGTMMGLHQKNKQNKFYCGKYNKKHSNLTWGESKRHFTTEML